MACKCDRPKLGRLDFLKRLVGAFRSLSFRGALTLCHTLGAAFTLYGVPCRAAAIEGVEEFVQNFNAGR